MSVNQSENASDQIQASIIKFLTSKHLAPTQTWLQSLMPSIRPTLPIASLQQTALFRMLSSDLTLSTQPSPASSFPSNIADPELREQKLRGPIIVQLLDIEDVARSCWSQVEALEMQERGEMTRGTEVIRVVAESEDAESAPSVAARSAGPHKLLLQDAAGTRVFAFELEPKSGIGVGMAIGTKLLLSNLVVARGVVLLQPAGVELVGGKIEAWDKKWRDERKAVLKQKAGWRDTAGGPAG